MLDTMIRALPAAVLVGVAPGYFWAKSLAPSAGYVERIAYSTALSMTLVPTAALLQVRVFGTGVTFVIAAVSVVAAFAMGYAAYLWFGTAGYADEPVVDPPPAQPRPGPPGGFLWPLASSALIVATLLVVLVRGYLGPVLHDWPFIRGGDQFSHAVMTNLMMTEGDTGSFLIYPPGFHTLSALVSRLSGLEPLEVFPVLAPALTVLPALACYALARRLWGQSYGVVAAFYSGVLLVGPYASFAEARYPNLVSADFLIVLAVAALIGVYTSPGVRSGLLFAALGSSVVLYHQVASFYLALLLALIAAPSLLYLLLAGRRKGAIALSFSLILLGSFSVAYAWSTYDLPDLVSGLVAGGSDTGAGGKAVTIAIGSQDPLSLEHLLSTTSQPVAWLGLLGALLVAGELLRARMAVPQRLAYLTLLLWVVLLFAGSRLWLTGFPQRFGRDLCAPLAVLGAFGFVAILRSLPLARRKVTAVFVTSLAILLMCTLVGLRAVESLKIASGPSVQMTITPGISAAGEWLRVHNDGGNIMTSPHINQVPSRMMLAMGGYSALQSFEPGQIDTPRDLPPTGPEPPRDVLWVMKHPQGERTERLLREHDVGYIVLYKDMPDRPTIDYWNEFKAHPNLYRAVFENEDVLIVTRRHG